MADKDVATDEQLGPLLDYFAERLNRVFAYYFCVLEFEEDEDMSADPGSNARAWSLQTIKNACLHESLIAIRDLDDFLGASSSQQDGLRASDFGYQKSVRFLTKTERDSINKLVAHTTMVGATSQGFRWDIWELTTKCVFQCLEFLTWIETAHVGFQLWTSATICRTKTQKIYDYVSGEVSSRR